MCVSPEIGNCSPIFLRMTVNQIANNEDLYRRSCLPLGGVVHPLAELPVGVDAVPLVEDGGSGPVRCIFCGAYVNPFSCFINQGWVNDG